MKTTIDNNQKVFVVTRLGFSTKNIFCNLSDIPNVLKEFEKNDNFKVQHYWNFKLKNISKKALNEMFKANQINFKIN
jgi:hypothetical protein